MALLRVDVISKALDMATSFMAVLPDEGKLQKTRVVSVSYTHLTLPTI